MDWKNDLQVDEYIIIECYRKLDPTQMTDVFNDIFLKRYVTHCLKNNGELTYQNSMVVQ